MCIILGLFVAVSLGLGILEIGLLVQPFLNIGFGYFVARQRKCDFRWADALKIIFASGTILLIATALALLNPIVFGPLIGLISAIMSIFYIPYRVFGIFPKGGRMNDPSFLEDVKDLIDERKRGM